MSVTATPGARSRPTWPGLAARWLSGGLELVAPSWLPRRSAADVREWFADDALATLRAGGRPLPMSVVVREVEGGRRYAFHVPGYAGPRVVSPRAFPRRVRGLDRLLLPAIPRRDRWALCAAAGQRYVLADIACCFPTLLGTVADDEDLLAACRGDLHQASGDVLAPHLAAVDRRRLGKAFDNAIVGLVSPSGWLEQLRELGMEASLADARRMHARWWARFARARDFRDTWVALHRDVAAANRPLRLVYPDGRPCTFDAATVRGLPPRPRWTHLRTPEARRAAATRTTFSAIWRGVEGLILDEALHRLTPLGHAGLRLVVPLYDGLLLQAPVDAVEALSDQVRAALLDALAAVGVPARVTVSIAPAWGRTCDV